MVLIKTAYTCFLILFCSSVFAQVYIEKQSRHRFAQLNLGFDYQTNIGGKAVFQNFENGNENTLDLGSVPRFRFVIGGLHFWGHADFYVAIPIYEPSFIKGQKEVFYSSGTETVFKFYPWKIKERNLRPYIGTSLAPFSYQQIDNSRENGNGPIKNHVTLPLLTGFTYNFKSHLIEFGLNYNYLNRIDYYSSAKEISTIETPPVYINLSYRYLIETTLGAEKSWESGETERITQLLAEQNKLNGLFLGIGLSSAWWLKQADYNKENRPFIGNLPTSTMLDYTLGYYIHKPDINIALNYRAYTSSSLAYGYIQRAERQSLGLELYKFFLDYHGFVPFIGPIISHEWLAVGEQNPDFEQGFVRQNKFTAGVTFGWDIRPNRLGSWILRTNLRYFPNLRLELEDSTFDFDNIEFNFIQLIIYPGRLL